MTVGRSRRARLWAAAAATGLLTIGAAQAAADSTAGTTLLASPSATLAQLTQAVGGRGATQTPARYAYLRKLDGHLQAVALSGAAAEPVDVYVNGDAAHAAAALRALGMRVDAVSDRAPGRVVEGALSPASFAAAAALPETRAILPTSSLAAVGSRTSEGDGAIFGPAARALGPNGAGVSVGIISDSMNQSPVGGVAASQVSGDLPAGVQTLVDQPGGTDEGRAMAEIVYDEAPGLSNIAFASGTLAGGAAKAASIDTLVSHGVNVIADDIGILNEPFFQDGIVALAVDRARAAGVAYFSAAGNDSGNAWEGQYTGGASEDFDPGAPVDPIQSIGPIPAGRAVSVVLQWAEPWGGATTDFALDVYQVSPGPQTLLGTANTDNLVSGIPMESGALTIGSTATTLGLAIRRVAGTGSPFLKYIAFTNGAPVAMEHPAASGTISPDASSAAGALTVAASPYGTPASAEPFSSHGPVRRFFDAAGNPLATPQVRQKPELAAPDGVTTSLAAFAPFFGTSAAAPAAAGIAALILSAKPAIGVDGLAAIMTSPANAVPCAPECGAGFLLADRAVRMALDGTPPVITASLTPAVPDGANGWYRGPVAVNWNVSDAESPVIHPAGCAGTTLAASGTLTCSATSAGGIATVPLAVKVDGTPPSAPTITGIAARAYAPAALPGTGVIRCSASDPTSGIDRCAVQGFSAVSGSHTLTAVATNDAGLTATSTLTYTVVKPPAIARLTFGKGITLARLLRSGLPLSVRVAARSTRLVVRLEIQVPRASGQGAVTVVLARIGKRVPAGTARLQLTLTAKAKRQLAPASRATLKVTVSGSSPLAKGTSLTQSVILRR